MRPTDPPNEHESRGGDRDAADPLVARMVELALVDPQDGAAIAHLLDAVRSNPALGLEEDDLLGVVQAMGRGVDRIAAAGAELAVRRVRAATPEDRERLLDAYLEETYHPTIAAFALMYGHRVAHVARRRVRREAQGGEDARTVSVGFVDLRGSTEYMLHSDDAAIEALANDLYVVAQRIAAEHEVTAGKFLGDGVLLVSADAGGLREAALATVTALGHETPLRAGGGIARGRVVRHAGDWHGTPVNLAARLAEHALPDEVLVDAGPASEGDGTYRTVTLRGLAEPRQVAVHTAPR